MPLLVKLRLSLLRLDADDFEKSVFFAPLEHGCPSLAEAGTEEALATSSAMARGR